MEPHCGFYLHHSNIKFRIFSCWPSACLCVSFSFYMVNTNSVLTLMEIPLGLTCEGVPPISRWGVSPESLAGRLHPGLSSLLCQTASLLYFYLSFSFFDLQVPISFFFFYLVLVPPMSSEQEFVESKISSPCHCTLLWHLVISLGIKF